jgi:AraC-like DNA-binding protein
MSATKQPADIGQLNYRPSGSYPLDLEIFSVSDLRGRAAEGFLRSTHRYRFHMLLCVTRGECTHMIDFKLIACKPGSLLIFQPTQAHRFGFEHEWEGWVILFRQEFLLSSHALLLRLTVLHDRQQAQENTTSVGLQRFRNFQRLVEKKFCKWHGVAEYADLLGCSEKSLTRAAMEVAGVKAKAFITSRINLEAKRLLAHTTLSIALIGERLGFQDSTNFVKFFKREVGCTPGEFRCRQAEVRTSVARKVC